MAGGRGVNPAAKDHTALITRMDDAGLGGDWMSLGIVEYGYDKLISRNGGLLFLQ